MSRLAIILLVWIVSEVASVICWSLNLIPTKLCHMIYYPGNKKVSLTSVGIGLSISISLECILFQTNQNYWVQRWKIAKLLSRECVRNLILRVHTAAIAAAAVGTRAWARRDDRHRRVLSFIRLVRPRSYLDFPKKSIFLSDLLTYLSSSEWGKLGTSI